MTSNLELGRSNFPTTIVNAKRVNVIMRFWVAGLPIRDDSPYSKFIFNLICFFGGADFEASESVVREYCPTGALKRTAPRTEDSVYANSFAPKPYSATWIEAGGGLHRVWYAYDPGKPSCNFETRPSHLDKDENVASSGNSAEFENRCDISSLPLPIVQKRRGKKTKGRV
ncbi:uncharacterized protein CIMG_03758 [Coccidioides immitis RS]|uniref:Uncharacterized protein n=3 Tax=Coccidioides immitis TaxID=5501 RepID=J3KC20_COCIM|nr:uncharacterized protein CIMG_03758 [Coccidioides immitis RS]EAS32734.3 hypothetical protein CIMG_03758 [Coccidioides immitis RS]KMP07996.1 hypothetical protein CIRG_07677 [Coccidioides immitis RMSCC 2394]KMU85187.1 hypothetical protein CIHG_02970 [Coccidioides immitis H538.4]